MPATCISLNTKGLFPGYEDASTSKVPFFSVTYSLIRAVAFWVKALVGLNERISKSAKLSTFCTSTIQYLASDLLGLPPSID